MRSKSAKKPAAAAFALDGAHAFVADKFGDVAVAATGGGDAAPLLGHYSRCAPALAPAPPAVRRAAICFAWLQGAGLCIRQARRPRWGGVCLARSSRLRQRNLAAARQVCVNLAVCDALSPQVMLRRRCRGECRYRCRFGGAVQHGGGAGGVAGWPLPGHWGPRQQSARQRAAAAPHRGAAVTGTPALQAACSAARSPCAASNKPH